MHLLLPIILLVSFCGSLVQANNTPTSSTTTTKTKTTTDPGKTGTTTTTTTRTRNTGTGTGTGTRGGTGTGTGLPGLPTGTTPILPTLPTATIPLPFSQQISLSSGSPTSSGAPSLETVSSCVAGCIAAIAAESGCGSLYDYNCYCTSYNFAAQFPSCVVGTCSDSSFVLLNAESLVNQFCAIATPSTNLKFSDPTVTYTGATTSPTTSAAAAASNNSAVKGVYSVGLSLAAAVVAAIALLS